MKVKKVKILSNILNSNNKYVIPIYQRKYKWGENHTKRLVQDIIAVGESKKEHFTGCIINKPYESKNGLKKSYLVDGQQRLTTILLIIKAINLISKDRGYKELSDKTYKEYILFNKEPSSFKIEPCKDDFDTFKHIMFLDIYNNIKNDKVPLLNNFKTVYELLNNKKYDSFFYEDVILNGIDKLTSVLISLDEDDDPQEIFESLNSLGLRLTNTDLIRNYLLMSMTSEKQKELYEKYWKPIQDDIEEKNMESFVFDFVMMKTSNKINKDDVYKKYVEYTLDKNQNKEDLLKDLQDVSKIYLPFIKYSKDYDDSTNKLMQELRDMNQTTAYPFLMRVFFDYNNGIIKLITLKKVINLIVVYLVRRTICNVPTSTLRGFMLTLYNRVFEIEENKNKYYESIYAFLFKCNTNDKMCKIDDVKEHLKTSNLYKNDKFTRYLLFRIENGRYPESGGSYSGVDNPTIEHIIPQTLNDEWKKALGKDYKDIHDKFLHTLGNLTLISGAKNSSMSNNSYTIKKDFIKKYGDKFTILNEEVITKNLNSFGGKEVCNRYERLADIVCEKYDLKEIDIEGFKFKYDDEIETVVCPKEKDDIFLCTTPISYTFFNETKNVKSYKDIVVEVAKELYNINPSRMKELANENYSCWKDKSPCIFFSNEEDKKTQQIYENIRTITSYNNSYCVYFVAKLLEQFEIDYSCLSITYKPYQKYVSKEFKIVSEALESLSFDKKIIYNSEMPTKYDVICFKTSKLEKVFSFNGNTSWYKKPCNSICLLTYDINKNNICITIKNNKDSIKYIDMMKSLKDDFNIPDDFHKQPMYIDLKEYKVLDNHTSLSNEKKDILKKNIELVLDEVDKDLDKVTSCIDLASN